ncbi:hypothetical protein SME36J_46290 [Serratia marcescens]|nr:hypothetical protein SME36J_46290 [Serratia marcescens]
MLWLYEWHRLFLVWFLLSIAIFGIDSLVENQLRAPDRGLKPNRTKTYAKYVF